MCELSLLAVTGIYSLLAGFSLQWLLLLQSMGSRCTGAVMSQTGLVAPWYVGPSWTRDESQVSSIGRRILNHWTTEEVPDRILIEILIGYITILECEVKWPLGSITMNKANGGDGIPVELFQILKNDVAKVLHSICQQIWKTQHWPQD